MVVSDFDIAALAEAQLHHMKYVLLSKYLVFHFFFGYTNGKWLSWTCIKWEAGIRWLVSFPLSGLLTILKGYLLSLFLDFYASKSLTNKGRCVACWYYQFHISKEGLEIGVHHEILSHECVCILSFRIILTSSILA